MPFKSISYLSLVVAGLAFAPSLSWDSYKKEEKMRNWLSVSRFGGVRTLQNFPSFHFSNGKQWIESGVLCQSNKCAPKNVPIVADL